MPNLTATQLLKLMTKATGTVMGEAEMRTFEHSAARMLFANQNRVFRDTVSMKQSLERPTKAILLNRTSVALGTAKQAAHSAAAFPDSFEKDIAFVQLQRPFKVSLKQAQNNIFLYEEILTNEIRNAYTDLVEGISDYIVSWLDTNRSQVATNSLISFDGVTDFQYENTLADRLKYFDYLKAAMRKNKYNGTYQVIADQSIAALHRELSAQGAGNQVNQQYQMPGIDLREEPQITTAGGGFAYAFQAGMVGAFAWNEAVNRQGLGDPGDNRGLFTTINDPILGIQHDVHVKAGVVDTSGSSGNPQDIVDEYEITTIFTVQSAYESTANATPIFKFAQNNA